MTIRNMMSAIAAFFGKVRARMTKSPAPVMAHSTNATSASELAVVAHFTDRGPHQRSGDAVFTKGKIDRQARLERSRMQGESRRINRGV